VFDVLWGQRWNNEKLKNNMKAVHERATLMHSEELASILANWHQPPRTHGSGVRTMAAKEAMNLWAIATVSDLIDDEIKALEPILSLPKKNVSEKSLLAIKWEDLIDKVQSTAPTFWRVIRNASYSRKQDARNTMKSPDAVG